jgi:hypothetical protein
LGTFLKAIIIKVPSLGVKFGEESEFAIHFRPRVEEIPKFLVFSDFLVCKYSKNLYIETNACLNLKK